MKFRNGDIGDDVKNKDMYSEYANPFWGNKEKEQSEYSDSEIDDEHIKYLRQLKHAQDTIAKYNELHEKWDNELDITHVSIQKMIESPLKISLSQLFQNFEDDFLNDQQTKHKYFKRLGREFHYHPNLEQNLSAQVQR